MLYGILYDQYLSTILRTIYSSTTYVRELTSFSVQIESTKFFQTFPASSPATRGKKHSLSLLVSNEHLKVRWVEHIRVEQSGGPLKLYRNGATNQSTSMSHITLAI